ncbi:MAG: hypothetical protein IJ523_10015 [Succinivibrionaceae bacterium]|nr:hypothetical protein [Succinivibrionaceae bacterium]
MLRNNTSPWRITSFSGKLHSSEKFITDVRNHGSEARILIGGAPPKIRFTEDAILLHTIVIFFFVPGIRLASFFHIIFHNESNIKERKKQQICCNQEDLEYNEDQRVQKAKISIFFIF